MTLYAHPHGIFAAAAVVVIAAAIVGWIKTRDRTTDEERERMRREYLTEGGRIIDGTLLGVDDLDSEHALHDDGARVLYYSYEISGVVYESSQDVKQLQQFVRPDDCRLGLAVSIRYDPRNHANSIIVAESWSGLRKSRLRRTERLDD